MKTATPLPNEAKSPRYLISERSERLHFFISEASSLARRATSLKKARGCVLFSGVDSRIRTGDLLLRRQLLYPAELRVHTHVFLNGACVLYTIGAF